MPEPRDFHGSALIGDIGLAFALVQRLSTNEKPFLCFYPLLFIPPVLPDRLPLLLCYPHSLTLIWDLIMTVPLDFHALDLLTLHDAILIHLLLHDWRFYLFGLYSLIFGVVFSPQQLSGLISQLIIYIHRFL